jgi:hypothetical protein
MFTVASDEEVFTERHETSVNNAQCLSLTINLMDIECNSIYQGQNAGSIPRNMSEYFPPARGAVI